MNTEELRKRAAAYLAATTEIGADGGGMCPWVMKLIDVLSALAVGVCGRWRCWCLVRMTCLNERQGGG